MYQTILVPLDGSERAEAILPHVENLAQVYRSRVVLVRVEEARYFVPEEEDVLNLAGYRKEYERRHQEIVDYLANIQGRLEEKNIRSEVRIPQDAVVAAIIDLAEQEKADLIAIASHGRTGLARAFYGSVASGLLNRADRPLLVIRSRESE